MAEMRVLAGSSSMEVFMQSESNYAQSLEALVAAGNSGFLYGHGNAITQPFYQTVEFAGEICNIDLDEGLQQHEKKRRLTVDQLQLLEQSFESENKLEPERKVQLAKELGLQPRQVAIWFQNRRARWKTKQLEKEFEVLKSSYDTLKLDHDKLFKEREELQAKVLSLTNMLLEKEKGNDCVELNGSNIFADKMQKLNSDADLDVKSFNTNNLMFKEEDRSSGNSTVFDSERPAFMDGGYSMLIEPTSSSSAREPDHSEISQICEVDEVKVCELVTPENTLCNYELHVGDQAWEWPSI